MENLMCKVLKEGKGIEYYVLKIEWNEEILTLTVIDNDNAWTGKVESIQVSELCKAVHKTKEEYLKELKRAFLESEREFTFMIDLDQFIVKKVDLRSNIKIKFCTIQLEEIPLIPTYLSLLSELLDEQMRNKSKMSQLAEELQYLKIEREDFKRKLQRFSDEKASLETLFYSKFCEILNAKKEKIAHLESQIGAGGDTSLKCFTDSVDKSNTNEQIGKKLKTSEKRKNQDYPATKRKCSEIHSEVNKTLKGNAVPSTSEVNETDLNLYDSETDIDTDEEISENNPTTLINVKTVSSSLDALEETPPRILPKRECSNVSSTILPKREHSNISVMDNKNKERKIIDADCSFSLPNNDFEEEFNSQSLLDDY